MFCSRIQKGNVWSSLGGPARVCMSQGKAETRTRKQAGQRTRDGRRRIAMTDGEGAETKERRTDRNQTDRLTDTRQMRTVGVPAGRIGGCRQTWRGTDNPGHTKRRGGRGAPSGHLQVGRGEGNRGAHLTPGSFSPSPPRGALPRAPHPCSHPVWDGDPAPHQLSGGPGRDGWIGKQGGRGKGVLEGCGAQRDKFRGRRRRKLFGGRTKVSERRGEELAARAGADAGLTQLSREQAPRQAPMVVAGPRGAGCRPRGAGSRRRTRGARPRVRPRLSPPRPGPAQAPPTPAELSLVIFRPRSGLPGDSPGRTGARGGTCPGSGAPRPRYLWPCLGPGFVPSCKGRVWKSGSGARSSNPSEAEM